MWFQGLLTALFANLPILISTANQTVHIKLSVTLTVLVWAALLFAFLFTNISPERQKRPDKRLKALSSGCRLLRVFSSSTLLSVVCHIFFAYYSFSAMLPWREGESAHILMKWIGCVLFTVLAEAIIFWNGMIRVYLTSVQLGIKHRVLAALLGLVPIANICYLVKIIKICSVEVAEETEKYELDIARDENEVCKTKYPILLVHGVFFRDSRYLNYWGRIPKELIKNGAEIYYGAQQSAGTVMDCGKELADKIREITGKTGCEKVNIIAHSKGGLDSRAAITHFGAAPYVASLTTINTPHRGCIFAEYLLKKAPEKLKNTISSAYNSALLRLGDKSPDFIGAVSDLTASACEEFNKTTPDSPDVLYESVMSYCKRAHSGKFPLNVSYPVVKHFDGKNDGLVSVESAIWGTNFTLLEPHGSRGISHGDMIDLNRENINGFDVREFYVSLAASLKERGY